MVHVDGTRTWHKRVEVSYMSSWLAHRAGAGTKLALSIAESLRMNQCTAQPQQWERERMNT